MSAPARTEERSLEPKRLRRVLVGRPMQTGQLHETLLPKWLALPIFASDPLSSVAYATEAALVVLITASATSGYVVFPISLAIAALLLIVVLSYRQTVHVYESSGGAYVVAKENLGKMPSLVAAAALLTDYILTVAVSVAAGVLALSSAVPALRGHELELSLVCVLLIALANLRGVKEAGVLFAIPTYAFVTSIFILIGAGIGECASGSCPRATSPHPLAGGVGALTLFVVLRAFASGSTALTGVEAIANGVNAFRRPHGRNAAATLGVLGAIAIAMFLGVSWLAVHLHAQPSVGGTPSVLSEIARAIFPSSSAFGFLYWAVQSLTLAVLVLAANTVRASCETTEAVVLGRASTCHARYETPRNSEIAITPSTASVVAALRPCGRRKALTPFAIASTPVNAVDPDENAFSSRKRVTVPAPTGNGLGTTAWCRLPVAA